MIYQLNRQLAYYIINADKVVISSFYKDEAIDCRISAQIIELLNNAPMALESMVTQIDAPLPIILNKFNILKYSGILIPLEPISARLLERTIEYTAVSQGYFYDLISTLDDSALKAVKCSDGKTLLQIDFSDSQCTCVLKRVLSLRPLLAYVKKELTRTLCIQPNSIRIQVPTVDETHDGVVEIELANGYVRKHCFQHYSDCHLSEKYTSSLTKLIVSTGKKLPYRSTEPEQTVALLTPLISKYTGIISVLESYGSKVSEHIYNYVAGKNTAFAAESLSWVRAGLRSANGGKGTNQLQAQCSALCEAIERYSMVHHDRSIDAFCSLDKLNLRCVTPTEILNFSESQFALSDSQDKTLLAPQHWIPKRFDSTKPYHWVKALSISKKEPVFIPAEIAYTQLSLVEDCNRIAMPDSNGCAAGGTLLEAAFQGTLELIERDAIAIWWYNRLIRKKVNTSSLNSEYVRNILKDFERMGRSLAIIEISSDIDVPVYAAVSYEIESRKQVIYGFGCHVYHSLAIERAVTEVCQLLPAINNPQTARSEPAFFSWLNEQTVDEHSFLNSDHLEGFDLSEELIEESLEEDFFELVSKLKVVEQELIIFDLTVADIHFPVVKVISPGLRHFWRRAGKGRLFDVPVKMGFFTSALSECELNSFDITI